MKDTLESRMKSEKAIVEMCSVFKFLNINTYTHFKKFTAIQIHMKNMISISKSLLNLL